MKIRIRGNSIRFRLTQSEVRDLGKTGFVEESTMFPAGSSLIYGLQVGDQYDARFNGDSIRLELPKGTVEPWLDSEELSIDHSMDLANGKQLRLLIEKDLQCLVDRAGEDDSDAFPNPNENC